MRTSVHFCTNFFSLPPRSRTKLEQRLRRMTTTGGCNLYVHAFEGRRCAECDLSLDFMLFLSLKDSGAQRCHAPGVVTEDIYFHRRVVASSVDVHTLRTYTFPCAYDVLPRWRRLLRCAGTHTWFCSARLEIFPKTGERLRMHPCHRALYYLRRRGQ